MEGPVNDQIQDLQRTYGTPIPRSWSANFEDDPYRSQPELIFGDALRAIAATHPVDQQHDPFVNLVTPGEAGDPADFLIPRLKAALGPSIRIEEVGQCGCGGYVVRVWRYVRQS